MSEALFSLPSDAYAVTSDDCYTPRWVFDAMGLHFDLDVASPPGGPWHVPCDRWYTAEDDGLSQPWDGLVWCNPPYSQMTDWVMAWASHDRGCLMGMVWTRAALTLALVAVLTAHPADATVTQRSQPCNSGTYNYATINAPCVWDGRHGADSRSFVVSYAADFYYIRHIRAHCMLRAHEVGACPGGKR